MNTLLLLAKIKPAEEAGLREVLAEIQEDQGGNPFIRLSEVTTAHFARWNIVEDDDNGPRLLFSTTYDGGIEAHIDQLVTAGSGMDEIWGRCEGYRSSVHFTDFARTHFCKPVGVYVAFPADKVSDIRNYMAINDELEQFLDLMDVASYLTEPGCNPFLDRLAAVSRGWRYGSPVSSTVAAASAGVHDLALDAFLGFARWFAAVGQTHDFPRVRGSCDPDGKPPRENEQMIDSPVTGRSILQNEMTNLLEIVPGRFVWMRIALFGSAVLSQFGYPPGQFANVGTLYWFAWSVIDNGKRLLFLSTFDGSWQNYMQDFINKLIWALDAVYNNVYGYPEAGMKDIIAFTDFILTHQFPAQAFYSAYPDANVVNLMRSRSLSRELTRSFDRNKVEQWLGQL